MPKRLDNLPPGSRRTVAMLIGVATLLLFTLPLGFATPWDKVMHGAFFGVLTLLAFYLAEDEKRYLLGCLGVVALSAIVEVVQSQVPGRQMSVLDLLANIVGMLCAAALLYVIKGRKSPGI